MSLDVDALGSFADLAAALGMLDANRNVNASWFSDPVGGSTANERGLRTVVSIDDQRDALVEFVDALLGAPDRSTRDGAVWVPLFVEGRVTVSAVIDDTTTDHVLVGVGVEHATAPGEVQVTTRVHAPVFRMARAGRPAPIGNPAWSALGNRGGRIGVSIDATFDAVVIGGVALTAMIPTHPDDELGIDLELRDVLLPGATQPTTFRLDADSVDDLGSDLLDLLLSVVRAQADALDENDAAVRPFTALAGLLGLRTVADIPAFPLADLATRGIDAIVSWLDAVINDGDAHDAWLGELADLIGADVDAANDAVCINAGPLTFCVGVRTAMGTGGHLELTPWIDVGFTTGVGAQVHAEAELFRLDIGTGSIIAVPTLRVEAVFGADAGGAALLGGSPSVGSLRAGVVLDAARRPAFTLTLHDVTFNGRVHPILDLSSPDAALDAAGDVVGDALVTALDGLGAAGSLAAALLGLAPPAGVTALDPVAVLADPFGAIRGYWIDLVASASGLADVVAAAAELLTGTAVAVPGGGTPTDPWRIDLPAGIDLLITRVGSVVTVAFEVGHELDVLGDHSLAVSASAVLLRVDLATPAVSFLDTVDAAVLLRRQDAGELALAVGPLTFRADALEVRAGWTAAFGLLVDLDAEGLAIVVAPTSATGAVRTLPVPLPRRVDGTLVFDAPDWLAIERILAVLLRHVGLPGADALVTLAGWEGGAPRLALGGLLADPVAAVQAWLPDTLLDCAVLRRLLAPVAGLLAATTTPRLYGYGTADVPYLAPIAAHRQAPGVAAWLEPGCPPYSEQLGTISAGGTADPTIDGAVAALVAAAEVLPDVADLLQARPGLADGMAALVARWVGTDGIVGLPTTVPTGVTTLVLDGFGYDDLAAFANQGYLLGDVFTSIPGAVVYVGCEPSILTDRPVGMAVDLAGAVPASTTIPDGDGAWFVRLPEPTDAATLRPDRGAIGEQAARLGAFLATRTAPVAIVAHGAAGAAAIRAAASIAAVSDVVTVGTPWGPVAVEGLRTDTLRFLVSVESLPAPAWPEDLEALQCTSGHRLRRMITRANSYAAPGTPSDRLPPADTEAIRPGLNVAAVFASVTEQQLVAGLASLVDEAIADRAEQAATAVEPEHDSLHVGVQLPVADLDIGGVLVGVGAIVELAALGRADTVTGLSASTRRRLIIDVHFGITDGWLVGGPGAASDEFELRWMQARVAVPLGDGPVQPADVECRLVLHEAKGFDAFRQRWIVRADADGVTSTVAVPEVRVLVSGAVQRVTAAVPALGDALAALGLVRDGGVDPEVLDRLLHDPVLTVSAARATTDDLASALRALVPGATGSGSSVAFSADTASAEFDLATGTLTVSATSAPTGLPAATLSLTAGPASVLMHVELGTLDADRGGLRLVADASSGVGATSSSIALHWAAPGGAVPRSIPLLPFTASTDTVTDLLATLVPAAGLQLVAEAARRRATSGQLDAVLDAVGLLSPPADGPRFVVLPFGLVAAPGAWLRRALDAWRTDLTGAATGLLDALAPLVASGPLNANVWPLVSGAALQRVVTDGRLCATVLASHAATVGTGASASTVTFELDGGVCIGSSGSPQPALTATVLLGASGVRLTLTPNLTVELVRASAAPLRLYPGPVSIGDVVGGVATMVLPPVMDALMNHRTDAGSDLVKRAGQAVFDLAGALDLLTNDLADDAKLLVFATNPSQRLLDRLPQLAATAIAAVGDALDGVGTAVTVTTGATSVDLAIGTAVVVSFGTSLTTPWVSLRAATTLESIGPLAVDELRLDANGVSVAVRVGPAEFDLGGAVLRPLLAVAVGPAFGTSGRMAALGLAVSDDESVQFRWGLDALPPTVAVVTSTGTGETVDTDAAAVALRLSAIAATLAMSVAMPALSNLLDTPVAGVEPGDLLQGVVFTDTTASRTVDAAFFTDLLDADALIGRLQRLAWNFASSPLALTIGDATIGLTSVPLTGSREQVGVRLSLAPGKRLTLVDNDLRVDLEMDGSWIDPDVVADGLTVLILSGDPNVAGFGFEFAPGFVVAGVGLRVLQQSGPLLDLGGITLDAIALHLYGEVSDAGVGGGARIRLDGLAVAPAGSGGTNAVANSIMSDAGSAGKANRPVLAPSLAMQKHPGDAAMSVSLGLADPPGPWWVLVQRQLGPLYVGRVGLDTAEADGRITRITLLFDGSVSLFGLTASVDQLSLSWLGGDPFRLDQWAVDVAGFAVSADLSGVSLAGGLLKTTYEGEAAYVGMLLGRFGIYGLSVFGGYTTTDGSPSFFVFGAVNGPIGGPPAFFLTGIGGGLGINRGLRVPSDMSTFNDYPFIQALDPAASAPTDPMAELRELSAYFPPQSGTFWFAAGISFTSFALVDGVAVVSVAFGNGLEINLFGLARMALPRPEAALVSIEIGLLARFSTTEGVFSIQGQLTDNSWLLYEDVRLTGGFAFAVWWKGALAGQFVLTLGGYHPDFERVGYPVVPRLGITWQVTDDIVLKGGSYFALTSEALMAGTDAEVSANFGWAWARLAFGAHGIVYFDPFWFEVKVYVEISAGVKIKTWLGTFSFSVSMGAQVKVWGPDFSGEAKFGVGPCTLTVGFGSERRIEPETLLWAAFVAKYLEDAGGGQARALSSITGRGTLPASTNGAIGAPSSDGTPERPFEVFAEFEITFVTSVPATVVRGAIDRIKDLVPLRSDGATISLGLAPMRAGGLRSELNVSLTKLDAATGQWVPKLAEASILAANIEAAQPTATGSAVLIDFFPLGVWGEATAAGGTTAALPAGDVVSAGKGLKLVAEAVIPPQTGPEIDYYRTENGWKPLPLQATATGRTAMLTTGAGYVTDPATVTEALTHASATLFRPAVAVASLPAGVLATGARSRLAAASFVGERAAPPLFGTLTDGMARANTASTRGSVLPPKPPVTYAGMREPTVLAHLTGGSVSAARSPITTVGDTDPPRRPAPTLESVRERLSAQLPLKLVLSAPPGAPGRTLLAPVVPFTEAPPARRAHVTGYDGAELSGLVAGLGSGEARRTARTVAPGDVVVLDARDADADTDPERRPRLGVDGPAMVVMLRSDGSPSAVECTPGGLLRVPPHTRLIAVQAGAAAVAADRFAGWHATSRVASVGTNSALAAGCLLDVERATAGAPVGWARAADVVRDAASVTTRFHEPVTTVVLVLAGADPTRIDDVALDLQGGTVASVGGRPEPPAVALIGSAAVLAYRVTPTAGAPMSVTVRAGGSWVPAGVLGGTLEPKAVVEAVAADGIAALTGRFAAPAADAKRVTIAWRNPPGYRPPRPAVDRRPIRTSRRTRGSR